MEKQTTIYRNEVKYYISKREAIELGLLLRNVMMTDKYAKESGSYWIRSLYFDTSNNKDYYDKIIGYNERKKIRLRIYDLETDKVNLEIKNKCNYYCKKDTLSIARKDALQLINGNSYGLLGYRQDTANKVFAYMHKNLYIPKVIIDYEREAYLLPFENIRITLDRNIRSSSNVDRYFYKKINMIPVYNIDSVVLEVKYNHMIPTFLQRILSNFTAQSSQISKYCLGRDIL